MPQADQAPVVNLATPVKFMLDNGLRVLVVENHNIPKISFTVSLIMDPRQEGSYAGVADITGSMLGTGTTSHTKEEISGDIDFIGAELSAGTNEIYASSLIKHADKLLEILSDITINSVFTREEFGKKSEQILSDVTGEAANQSTIASNVFNAMVFGRNNPYGEFKTEKSVRRVTLQMCTDYYNKYFNPGIACLTITGDITPSEARTLAEKYFGRWQKKEVELSKYETPKEPESGRIYFVDRPQAVRSVVQIGYPVSLNLSDTDYIKARVTNTILTGGESRLFDNLCEKHAWASSVYSSFIIHPLVSCFKISTTVKTEVTDSSVYEILNEMNRIRNDKVSLSELRGSKNFLEGSFALTLENPRTIANMAVNTERYNLNNDFYHNYLKNIDAVTPEDVRNTALKYIKPGNTIIVIVGKYSSLSDKIAKLNTTANIQLLDVNADPCDSLHSAYKIPEGISAQEILDNYIKAIGGDRNINKIKDLTLKATINIQGNLLNFNLFYKLPDKYKSEVLMNGQTFQKEIFNAGNVKVWDIQSSHELNDNEKEKLTVDADPFPELHYSKMGFSIKLLDITSVDTSRAYRVEITSPGGNSVIDYFSVNNGLKIRSESVLNSPEGPVTQITDYVNYIEAGGIKFPKKLIQRTASQVIDIENESIKVNEGIEDSIFKPD